MQFRILTTALAVLAALVSATRVYNTLAMVNNTLNNVLSLTYTGMPQDDTNFYTSIKDLLSILILESTVATYLSSSAVTTLLASPATTASNAMNAYSNSDKANIRTVVIGAMVTALQNAGDYTADDISSMAAAVNVTDAPSIARLRKAVLRPNAPLSLVSFITSLQTNTLVPPLAIFKAKITPAGEELYTDLVSGSNNTLNLAQQNQIFVDIGYAAIHMRNIFIYPAINSTVQVESTEAEESAATDPSGVTTVNTTSSVVTTSGLGKRTSGDKRRSAGLGAAAIAAIVFGTVFVCTALIVGMFVLRKRAQTKLLVPLYADNSFAPVA